MLKSKIYLQYGKSSAAKLYDLPENSRSLVRALPGLYVFSGYNKTSCFEGEGTLSFVHYFKSCLTQTILTEKINAQSQIENILPRVSKGFIDYFKIYV